MRYGFSRATGNAVACRYATIRRTATWWLLFDGIVTLVLAAMIGSAWPISSVSLTSSCF